MAHSEPKKAWSFLAYIAGDNNLSDNGLEDIEELCKAGSGPSVHAAVQIDTYGEHDGSIRYEITPKDGDGAGHRTVISRLKESNSGNPIVLRNFVKWGQTRYPADKRLVVVWNHGSGFRSVRRDIAYDDFGSSLDMPEVTDALHKAGVTAQNKISIMGFDACLMNMLEIADHFSEQVEIIVGSEEVEPGDGWPYDKVLGAMLDNPEPEALARRIVEAYIRDYRENGPANVTQSAVRLSKTDAAMAALGALGKALAQGKVERGVIRQIRLAVQSYEYADYVDLAHLAELFEAKAPAVKKEAAAVKAALAACIIHADKYGPSVKNSNGLSVWFPTSSQQYSDYRTKYLQLNGTQKHAGWSEFLDGYLFT